MDWPHKKLVQTIFTPEKIVKAVQALPDMTPEVAQIVKTLTVDHIIVDFSTMHYGMKDKNPLDFVRFYSSKQSGNSRYLL
jgi:deoxynucleoside triphosphate triphosphohydrolase SAMHD1